MEGLDLENILDENQIETLFGEVETEDHEEEAEEPQKGKKEKEKENTAEVNPEDIFQEPGGYLP